MNEIEAEMAGEVVKVHHENGQPVQYGDPLFTIRPEPDERASAACSRRS